MSESSPSPTPMNSKFVLAFAGVALLHLAFGAVILSGCKSDGQKAAGTTPAVAANTTASVAATPPPPTELYEPTRPPPTTPASPLAMGHLDGEPLSPDAINSVPSPSAGPTVTYEVKKGDSMAKIAKDEKVSLAALEAANPGVVPAKLRAGQTLTIPTGNAPAPTAPASPTASAAASSRTYTVKSGDSLSKIAKANGTTVEALKSANHLTSDIVAVGKVLTVPEKSAPAPAPATATVPVRGGTSAAPIATSDSGTYTVQSGDSLDKIAGKLGVKTSDLMKLNNISDPRKLQVNQKLKIPVGAKAVSAAPSLTPSTPASLPPPPLPSAPVVPATPPAASIQSVEEVPVTPVGQ